MQTSNSSNFPIEISMLFPAINERVAEVKYYCRPDLDLLTCIYKTVLDCIIRIAQEAIDDCDSKTKEGMSH